MANARKTINSETIEDIRKAYPEFTRLLKEKETEISGAERAVRTQMDEQVFGEPGDIADVSGVETSNEFYQRLSNHQQKELNEIQNSFERIRKGTYGICEACDDPISLERLRRMPYARLCILCQSSLEKGRRHLGIAPQV